MTDDGDRFEARFVTQTASYVDEVEACVSELPTLIERYGADDGFRDVADRICNLESSCDRANRRITTAISNAGGRELGIRLTRLHLNSGATIELYQIVDEIANHAEQFAEELVAIGPSRSDACLRLLEEMAECAVTAMSFLRRVITTYVEMLCDPTRSGQISDEITQIRAVESDCDRVRNEVIALAFNHESIPQPLVYRELALLLDAVVDAIEDVTDQLVLTTGNQSWLDLSSAEGGEPDSEAGDDWAAPSDGPGAAE
ncbi:MAG: hypothetical protein ABEJ74_07870 [Haloferacaceae archaeon]